ncbi:MAG: hypothetical protein AB7S69_07475 [Salinivirgaceae bacterium]
MLCLFAHRAQTKCKYFNFLLTEQKPIAEASVSKRTELKSLAKAQPAPNYILQKVFLPLVHPNTHAQQKELTSN